MQLILLSGGSGKRLWPLSNDSFSKQFLRLLPTPDGGRESMLQRVVRQVQDSPLEAEVTIATGAGQRDAILSQLSGMVGVVNEPERRDTFPAIALSCLYLEKEKGCGRDEVVVVMPSDPYTDAGYFETIDKMVHAVKEGVADLVLMGIEPTYPSCKYGYIVPMDKSESVRRVKRFTEKPDEQTARSLMDEGALWNGGVFAFRLGYLLDIVKRYMHTDSFEEARQRYAELPKISFDYEVVEKAESVAVVPFKGLWKDLGTWDALAEILGTHAIGPVLMDENTNDTHVINRLNIPCICVGTHRLIVAIAEDGILVADKDSCERIKPYVTEIKERPHYEERRWGTYKVIDHSVGVHGGSLTKHLRIKAGKSISYQKHFHRDEVWTFIEGNGLLALDGEIRPVKQGDVIHIRKGQLHAVKALSDLHFIEVQMGDCLVEEDIARYEWHWPS